MPWFLAFVLASTALGMLGVVELLSAELNLRALDIACFAVFALATAAFGWRLRKGFRQYW